jgi:hypothetical protein
MSEYPEHDKMHALRPVVPGWTRDQIDEFAKNRVVGDFLEWLSDNGYYICRSSNEDTIYPRYVPEFKSVEKWLAEHFQIDQDKIDKEKRTMIEEIRRGSRKTQNTTASLCRSYPGRSGSVLRATSPRS